MTTPEAIGLLKRLIATPSVTKNEEHTATLLFNEMESRGYDVQRYGNNLIAYNKYFSESKQTVVLCSHHDTVYPNENYTLDPFTPTQKEGKLYGLGSNDAGGSLVSLFAAFDCLYPLENLRYNVALLFTAEEESSGVNGMSVMYSKVINPHLFVIGEPTSMDVAIAERGLMVLDCEVLGVSGHTAHNNTVNPIIKAMQDIAWFSEYKFDRVSDVLDEVKMSVTIINAGTAHNVVPGKCSFVVDVRNNGCYSNIEILEIIKQNVECSVKARSVRLNASSIEVTHPFVQCCIDSGSVPFGSQTLSDQALVACQSVKIGVGDTKRSHTSDEWIYISEIESGIDKFIKIFKQYLEI
ncbi:MAG: M20/M25/M40 family metallo-hydrolase [Rikenellaceae bacterium]